MAKNNAKNLLAESQSVLPSFETSRSKTDTVDLSVFAVLYGGTISPLAAVITEFVEQVLAALEALTF